MADAPGPALHTDIQQIDAKMFQLFALVVEALAAATDALLSGDRHVAAVLSGRDELVDNVYNDVERLVNRAVALESRDKRTCASCWLLCEWCRSWSAATDWPSTSPGAPLMGWGPS